MKRVKKALKKLAPKVLNFFIVLLMLFQPVGTPGMMVAHADDTVPAATAEPAPAPTLPPAPKEEPAPAPVVEALAPALESTPVPISDPTPADPTPVATPTPALDPAPAATDTVDQTTTDTTGNQGAGEGTSGTIDPVAATTENLVPAPEAPKDIWSKDGDKATTNYPVEKDVTYTAPQNDQVTVTFTKLPDNPGTLSIEEITLTNEQVVSLKALSDKAYDITSDMADGTFAYDLTLPKPADQENVEIKFAENMASLADAETVPSDDVETNKTSVNATLDHFTIFVVSGLTASPLCTGASIPQPGGTTACYTTIQAAINAGTTLDGDTINISAETYVENVNVTKDLTLQGVAGTNLQGKITISHNGVTIDGFNITNPSVGYGIIATDYSNLAITNNTIHDIGSTLPSGSAQAIDIISNISNVTGITISNNHISNVGNLTLINSGSGSAKGIYIGNSGGSMDFDGVIISNNDITNVKADGTHTYAGGGRGAYGILVNHDNHSGAGYGSTKNLSISNNTISNLDGLFSHAVGLEGNTPSAVVTGNTITGLTEHKQLLEGSSDAFALRLEDNPNGSTVTGTGNTLDGKSLVFGKTPILVDLSVPSFTGTFYPETLLNGSYYYAGLNAFPTIQSAIYASTAGDTIEVADGIYTYLTEGSPALSGLIKVTKGVTIKAAEGVRPVINGTGFDGVFKIHPSALLPGNTVIIEGFEIIGNEATSIAITTQGSYDVIPAKVIIRNNWFHGMVGGIDFWGAGGYLPVGWTSGVINTEITGNKFYDMVISGTDQGFGVMIEDPINLATARDYAVKIVDNEFSNLPSSDSNPGVGIVISRADGVLEAANVYMAGNSFTSVAVGIAIDGTPGIDVTDTRIINNDLSGTTLYGIMVGNIVNGPVNAENNWWGDASGPKDTISGDNSILDTNPNGIGSAAIGAIKYAPWYTDESMATLTFANPITEAATDPTLTGATVNGTNGDYDALNTSFWWGTTSPASPFNACTSCSSQLPSGWTHDAGLGAKTAGGSFSEALTGLTSGTPYYFVAWSQVGITWYPGDILTFNTLDNTPPAIPTGLHIIDHLGNNLSCEGYTNNRYITVDWIDNAESDFDHYDYQNRSGTTIAMPTSSEFSGNMADSDGYFKYRVRAVDGVGNASNWNNWCGITLDRVAPVAHITAPNNGDTVHGTVTISGTVTDVNPDHYYLVIKNSSNHVVAGPGTVYAANVADYHWNTTGVADGTYTIDLEARDAAGNKDSGSVTNISVTIDNTVPILAEVTPVTTPTSDTTPNYTFSSTEGGGVTYSGDCVSAYAAANSGNNTLTFNGLPDGVHSNCTITVHDIVGNTSTLNVSSFTVDTTAPATPSASPVAGDYTSAGVSVTLSSSDTGGSGVASIYYTTDGTTTPDNVTGTPYAGAITVDHDMTIKAIAYDNVDNASDILTAVYGIAPVISGETSSSVSETTATITWTTDDLATSRVIYDTVSHPVLGAAPNYGYASSTVEDSTEVTSHLVGLTGLLSGTTYYYRTVSHGSPETVSAEQTFSTTDGTNPDNVKSLRAKYRPDTHDVRVTWNVDDNDTQKVYLYRGGSKNFSVNSSSRIAILDDNDEAYTDDDITLGETYYYKAVARDAAGNNSSASVIKIVIPSGGTAVVVSTNLGTEAVPAGTILGTETGTEEQPTITEEPQGGTLQGSDGQVLGEEASGPSDSGGGMPLWQWFLIVLALLGLGYYGYGVYRGRRNQTIR